MVQTTTEFTTTVKGSAITIDLNLDNFVDSVSVVCADYAISCGARELIVTNLLTQVQVDLTTSTILSLSGTVLTIYTEQTLDIGTH
jgi:hypothetical protein